MAASKKPFVEGDRIVVKFHDGSVMGYFLSYYNRDYAVCTLDDGGDEGNTIAPRRLVFRAPAESTPPVANIQIFEATAPISEEA